jgi:hypothetical protein
MIWYTKADEIFYSKNLMASLYSIHILKLRVSITEYKEKISNCKINKFEIFEKNLTRQEMEIIFFPKR